MVGWGRIGDSGNESKMALYLIQYKDFKILILSFIP